MTRRFLPILIAFTFAVLGAGLHAQEQLAKLQQEYRALYTKVSASVVAIADKPYTELRSSGGTAVLQARAAAQAGFVVAADGTAAERGAYVICDAEYWMFDANKELRDSEADPAKALENLKHLYAITASGESFRCDVTGHDLRNLLLVLKLPADAKLPALAIGNSDETRTGSTAAVLGNSFDSMIVDRQVSFSVGSLTGFFRFEADDYYDEPNDFGDPYRGNVIEFGGAVNPGDYGGPMIGLDGGVMGLVTAHFHSGRRLGTAVPSAQFRPAFDAIVGGKAKQAPHLGFWLKNAARGKQRDPTITRIDAGSAAEKAGLRAGDVVVMIDGLAIRDRTGVRNALSVEYETVVVSRADDDGPPSIIPVPPRKQREVKSYGLPPGTVIVFTVRRGEELRTFEVTVGARAAKTAEESGG